MNRRAAEYHIRRIANSILAMEFPTQDAFDKYMDEHPDADPRHHRVVQQQTQAPAKQEKPTEKKDVPKEKAPEQKQAPEKGAPAPKGKYFTDEEMSLPGEAHQKAKDEESVYKDAEAAQEHMLEWLDRGKGIDKKLGLQHFDLSKTKSIDLDASGPILVTAPLKGRERARQKIQTEEGGDWSRLTDAVRATIAVDSPDEIDGVMKTLHESGMKLARQPKNRFEQPIHGYRDILMNVSYENGHVGELQIHIKKMLKAKEVLGGHKLYEQIREIKGRAAKEGKRNLTNDEQKTVDNLESKMDELYGAAWKDIAGRKASMSTKVAADGTRYYNYNGSPAIYERNKFPVIYINGKEVVFYDFWKFLHNADEITKDEYEKMMKKRVQQRMMERSGSR